MRSRWCIFDTKDGIAHCGGHEVSLEYTKTGWSCPIGRVVFEYGCQFGQAAKAVLPLMNRGEKKDAPSLLITHCPYCGSTDVHEVNRIEGHLVESVGAWCVSCDEEFVIDRNLDDSLKEAEEEDGIDDFFLPHKDD